MMNCYKNVTKFEEKSAIALRKDLIVNLYTLKKNLTFKKKTYEEKTNTTFNRDKILKESS